jgi:hypothetical protein
VENFLVKSGYKKRFGWKPFFSHSFDNLSKKV